MVRKQSSYKAIFVACLVVLNSLAIVPVRASNNSQLLESKLSIDVQEKIQEYKSSQELTADDSLFDLLKELLNPEDSRASHRAGRSENARLVIQTTEPTNEADIQTVLSYGGRIINPS